MNSQSRATEKWQKANGWCTKGYKVKKDLAEQFAAACKANGDAQANIIMDCMKKYLEDKGT